MGVLPPDTKRLPANHGATRLPTGSSATSHCTERLAQATAHPRHAFIADDYSLLDPGHIHFTQLLGHRQITDSYLLGLAVRHQCRFVTFDSRLNTSTVIGAEGHHWVTL